jgi:glutathione S-transferase
LIVHFIIKLQQSHAPPGEAFECDVKEVDIGAKMEQTEEWYLVGVNPKGLVPVLIGAEKTPLLDSKDIVLWLAERYPFLTSPQHASEIQYLVDELHKQNYGLLSFYGREKHFGDILGQLQAKLDAPGISEEYKKALQAKLALAEQRFTTGMGGLDENGMITKASLDAAEAAARKYLDHAGTIIAANANPTPWIFPEGPTIADAKVAVFAKRLLDVKREHLVPEVVQEKVGRMLRTPEWMSLLGGGSTMEYPGSINI